jgi:DNA polymerase III delta prime subunit
LENGASFSDAVKDIGSEKFQSFVNDTLQKGKFEDTLVKTGHIDSAINRDDHLSDILIKEVLAHQGKDRQKVLDATMSSIVKSYREQYYDKFKSLLQGGASPSIVATAPKDEHSLTPLHSATNKDDLVMVKLLLDNGADINAKDDYMKSTPLHSAAEKRKLEMAKLLLDNGANVNAKDDYSDTPLHAAAQKNNLEMAKLLISKGADANALNKRGGTPLHWAARNGNLKMAKVLLVQGVDINAKTDGLRAKSNEQGFTPLHYAAEKDDLEMVKLLLDNGADVNVKDQQDHTPWHIATDGGKVKEFLEKYDIDAIPAPKTQDEIFKDKTRDMWAIEKFFGGKTRAKKDASYEARLETVMYQNKVLQANNNLQILKMEAEKNLAELKKQGASQKKIDEATQRANYSKRMADLDNIKGFGRLAGYDKEKKILGDHVCAKILDEKNGVPEPKVPAGILFYGPFGSGKTTFAKALAGQADCQLVSVDHEDTPQETFKKIKEVALNAQKRFEQDRTRTIILLDEIDLLAPNGTNTAGRLKQFMDTSSEKYHCTLFATTNYPDRIDQALLRDGRFIKVGLPPADKENTAAILKHYAEAAGTTGDIKYGELAEQIVKTQPEEAFSNARIKTIVTDLAEETKKPISHSDLLKAINAVQPDILKEDLELFEKNMKILR